MEFLNDVWIIEMEGFHGNIFYPGDDSVLTWLILGKKDQCENFTAVMVAWGALWTHSNMKQT